MIETTLTDSERKEKYPVGTKIKYIGGSWDSTGDGGRIGTIVSFHRESPIIFLPESNHVSIFSTPDIPATWETAWESLKILSQKNQQLEFSFMSAMEGT